jgi:hypothetical protein
VTALLVAAAAGEDLNVVTRACAELRVDASALTAAENAGFITVTEDRVRFGHPLIRSALYATATAARHRELHAAIARIMTDTDCDRRAWHRSDSLLGPDEYVAEELTAVGRRAAHRGAFSVATTAAERAARLSPKEADQADRLLVAGTWAWRAGDGVRAT